MEGALLCILPDIKVFAGDDTLANVAMPSGRDLLAAVHPSLHGRHLASVTADDLARPRTYLSAT
jgi:hypothetical protein